MTQHAASALSLNNGDLLMPRFPLSSHNASGSISFRRYFQGALVRTILVVGALVCSFVSSHAQNIQRPSTKSDFTNRSDLRVDPSTLGLNIEIPLGVFPGRAGSSLPVILNYSSKVHQIKFFQEPGEEDSYSTWAQPEWSHLAAAGWTNSLTVPTVEWATTVFYDSSGTPQAGCFPGCWQVRHVQVTMPDGSSHILRHGNPVAQWPAGQPAPSFSGTYYAVDGSQLRYEYDSKILYLPDGSRYLLANQSAISFIDPNGNTQTYNATNKTWTDTMGRVISLPFVPGTAQVFTTAPGDYVYALPGFGTSSVSYTFRSKSLSNALTVPSQLQLYCDTTDPNQATGGVPGFTLFFSLFPDSVACGNGVALFNPVVLSELVLPTGQSYKFTYNIYGEIDKIVYPSGGYERYRYEQIPAADWMRGIYAQGNRGVVEKWISPKGNGSDEQQWQYSASYGPNFSQPYKVTITAPDQTHTERLLHTATENYAFEFRDVRVGRAYEERFYSATSQVLRRTLTEWTASPQNGTYANARDPRLTKVIEILLDTGGNALAQTTTNGYDAAQNLSSSSKYDFYSLDQTTAQSGSISTISNITLSGTTPLRTDETTYLVNDPAFDTTTRNAYIARNLVRLPSASRVIGPSGEVAKSLFRYDENSFISSGTTAFWSDPATTVRGNLTTSSNWLNAPNSYLSTHAQYDQYGNVRKTWDARDTGLVNPTQMDYTGNQFAYPTTTTSSIPDLTGGHGANVSLIAITAYDFNTGSIISTTDANNKTTSYTYSDVLNRVKTVTSADGGLTTYNYNDVPGSLYVETITKLTSSQSAYSYQFFDAMGRPNRSFHYVGPGSYITRDTQYDIMGRESAVSNTYLSSGSASAVNPSGKWTTTEYEDLGRVKRVKSPDNAKVETFYSGNWTLVKDQKDKERLSKGDGLGRVIEVWEIRSSDVATGTEAISFPSHAEVTAGYRTKYEYDTLGDLTKVTQSTSQPARIFAYDSLGRMITANNPESGTRSYSYDNNGNLSRKTDARGVVVDYTYDAFNRNTSIISTIDPAVTPAINHYYDGFRDGSSNPSILNGKGRLWQTETSGAMATRNTLNSTDPLGRPTNESQQFLNGSWSQPYTTQRAYNFAGGVSWQIYPSGRIVNFTYDAAGRPNSFTGNIGDGVQRTYATNIAYDEDSRMKEEQYGTQTPLYHKLHYNVRGQLNDIRLSTVSWNADQWNWNRGAIVNYYAAADLTCPTPECRLNSGSDNNGNLLQSQHWIPTSDQLNIYNWTEDRYAYDALNRLTSVAEFHGSSSAAPGAQDFTQVYDYDRFGNRTINQTLTTGNGAPKPWFAVVQATNRLGVPVGQSGNIHYDAAGNLDNDNYSSFGTSNGTATRTYDSDNRLTVVKDADQQVVSTYTYNGHGQRVRRKINGVETWQVYGIDGELLAEYRSGAAPMTATKEYGYRNGELLMTVASGDDQRLTRFVQNLYYGALQIDPTAQQMTDRTNELAAAGVLGQASLQAKANEIARSLFAQTTYESTKSETQYVSDLYYAYLQRAPDSSGLGWWAPQAVGGTTNRINVLNAFEASGEFLTLVAALYGSSASDNQRTENLVNNFYLGAYGTFPNSTQLQQQRDRLNNKAAEGLVQVKAEAEAMGRELLAAQVTDFSISDGQYVTNLYESFLQRGPDAGGLGFWTSQAAGGPADHAAHRQNVLNAFATCGPFRELAGALYREAFWLVPDHLGTTRMLATKSGSLASMKRHDYLPFGEELGLVAGRTTTQGYSLVDNVRQKFTQKERDVETNLDYFGERYYASVQARFVSADRPFADQDSFEPQSWNLYSYVRNNPLRYVDDFGDKITYTSPELEAISNALRAESQSYNTALKGFEGSGAPDLTIEYGDAGLDANGVDKAPGVITTSIVPQGEDGTDYPAKPLTITPARLKNATITVDNSEKGDKTKSAHVLEHEVGHADDARRNPKTYSDNSADTARTKGATPHDKRPNEIVANRFRDLVKAEIKEHKKKMKEEEKQRKKEEKQRKKEEKRRKKLGIAVE
jgi:RHS repeat-associated protein